MAVEATGTAVVITNSDMDNQSYSVTIPADAELCIVSINGLNANYTDLISELSLTAADTMSFTLIGQAYSYASQYRQCAAYYLVSPPTGNQTLYWAASRVGTAEEGLVIVLQCFKGVNTSNPIGDTEVDEISGETFFNTARTSSLTGMTSNDMGVGIQYAYQGTPDANENGQTAIASTVYRNAGTGFSIESGEDEIYFPAINDNLCIFFAINAGAATATATALPRRALDGPFYGSLRGSVR